VSSRLRCTVAVNERQGKTQYFDLIAWGKRAESLAHYLSVGKEMHFRGKITSAMVPVKDNTGAVLKQTATGREKDDNGNPYPAGAEIDVKVSKASYVIEHWIFGADSANERSNRPAGWDQPGTDGYRDWERMRAEAKAAAALPYQGQKDVFGKAKIGFVNGTPLMESTDGSMIPVPETVVQNQSMTGAGASNPDVAKLAALRGKGWRDDQILADDRFKNLAYLIKDETPAPPQEDVPAPPTTANAPTGV
jgi:single-stranded DNA-binding protein